MLSVTRRIGISFAAAVIIFGLALPGARAALAAGVVVDMPSPPPKSVSSEDATVTEPGAAASAPDDPGALALARYARARSAPRPTFSRFSGSAPLWRNYSSYPYGFGHRFADYPYLYGGYPFGGVFHHPGHHFHFGVVRSRFIGVAP